METVTRANTFARTVLLKWQFHVMLARFLDASRSEKIYQHVVAPALERCQLKQLVVFAKDAEGVCLASLRLYVDWACHLEQVRIQRNIVIGKKWVNQTAPEMHLALKHFEDFVAERGLKVALRLSLENDSELLAVARNLQLRPCPSEAWASPVRLPVRQVFKDLPELSIDFEIAETALR